MDFGNAAEDAAPLRARPLAGASALSTNRDAILHLRSGTSNASVADAARMPVPFESSLSRVACKNMADGLTGGVGIRGRVVLKIDVR